MSRMAKLFADSVGISKVLGPSAAIKWLVAIARNWRIVVRSRNLQIADKSMGIGPFQIHYHNNVRFQIQGSGAFSGIREMYVRDAYLHGGVPTIEPGDSVLDLGANMGNFTNLALAHGAASVVAVEPSSALNAEMRSSVELNPGFADRVKLLRTFVGAPDGKQAALESNPAYRGIGWLSEDDLIEQGRIGAIDFLKCDIEGGEYALLTPDSRVLKMTRKLAVEVHSFAGDVDKFVQTIVMSGFRILYVQRDPDSTVTLLAKRAQE